MHFPHWIDSPRNNKTKRAQLRLKYMLQVAALNKYGKASMHAIAADAQCDHSSIFNAIKRGWFTDSMAESIERAVGRDALPAAWLINPLEAGQVEA